jgi:hypothetical protein
MLPTFHNFHNSFKINGDHFDREGLFDLAYSYIKEGAKFEKEIGIFILDWLDPSETIKLQTSGTTGTPKLILISKQAMLESALATANFFNLKEYFMHFNTETKTYKLFNALYNGEAVSASQAHKRFGIKNISAEVSRVRQAGYAVYANSRKAGNGVKVTEYVIGKPSRKLVAAGYRAMALGLV